jgi:hypothetical protein
MTVFLPVAVRVGLELCMVFEDFEEFEDTGKRFPAIAGLGVHAPLETSVWSAADLEDEAIGLPRRG